VSTKAEHFLDKKVVTEVVMSILITRK